MGAYRVPRQRPVAHVIHAGSPCKARWLVAEIFRLTPSSVWRLRFREELDALDGEPGSLRFQALLQSDSHSERLRLFSGWLRKEQV